MTKIRIAIIGATGTTYKRTIPAIIHSDVCQIVAIQGRNLDKLKKIQAEYKIQEVYLDEVEMLTNANFDCIYIGTPPFLHHQNIVAAASTSKPIICEKPLSIDYNEGLEISKLLNAYSERNFMIAHHLRHQKAIHDIKEYIRKGIIGDTLNVYMQWGFEMNLNAPSAVWKTNPKLGGKGTFSDNGIHIVDLTIFLFGLPQSISGQTTKVRTAETFDNETALLKYDGFCVELHSSQSVRFPGNHLQIFGSHGSIEAYNGIGEKYISKVSIKSTEINSIIEYPETNLYANEVENFCKGLIDVSNDHMGTTLCDGLNALKIIDELRNSSQMDETIKYLP